METDPDRKYMRMALQQAVLAARDGEVPVGAIIVHDQAVIGRAHNQVERLKDPTAHAEMIAITQAASARADWRLTDTVLYVTKEPCPMCAGAIVLARITRVVWGMTDPVRGGAASIFNMFNHPGLNHQVPFSAGILEEECRELMQAFFKTLRANDEIPATADRPAAGAPLPPGPD